MWCTMVYTTAFYTRTQKALVILIHVVLIHLFLSVTPPPVFLIMSADVDDEDVANSDCEDASTSSIYNVHSN